ncbi:MAG: lytic transglycosylase domain-containing protein [Chromatiales bacterium]|nr:lytic transglycosylase domain-containing protein [Chromatiales bacterium]
MLNSLRQTALICALLLIALPSQGEIYKYVHNGVVTYSADKPNRGVYESLQPSCLLSYIGCDLARSDWSHVKLNHNAYRDLIIQIATRHQVDAALVRAVVHAESNFNHRALSKAGAEGLMQLMPDTQKRLNVQDPYNVWENIDGGTRLLKQLLKRYDNNIKHATAAYNAGVTAVEKYRGIPPYEETKNYVARVEKLYTRYKAVN